MLLLMLMLLTVVDVVVVGVVVVVDGVTGIVAGEANTLGVIEDRGHEDNWQFLVPVKAGKYNKRFSQGFEAVGVTVEWD